MKTIWSLIVAVLVLSLVNVDGVRGETRQSLIDQSFTSPSSANSNINGCCEYVSQTFTTGMNGTLKGASINVIQDYPYLTKLRVSINSVENGVPTMNVLVSKNLSSGSSSISEIIKFSQGIPVTSGVQYAIVVSYIDPPAGVVQGYWTGDINNSYAGGECFAFNGNSWTPCVQVGDVNFRTYINTDSMYDSVHNINRSINYDGTIQAAIDEANAGDEIQVDSGKYYGYFDVTKPLILRGVDTGMGKPIVDSEGIMMNTINLTGGGIILEGFNVTNTSPWNSGIFIVSDHNTVTGNDVSEKDYGIFVYESNDNIIKSNNATNNGMGLLTMDATNNTFLNNNISENNYAISLYFAYNNTYYNNNIYNNNLAIYLYDTYSNIFYNNLFNSTNYLSLNGANSNHWNITKTPDTTITGGPYLGGNFWANPGGTGFSQNCSDADRDGICNSSFTIAGTNIDYLPITYFVPDSIIPGSISNLRNITYAQTYTNWTWDEPADPDYYKVMIYIDGIFRKNVFKGEQFFNATGLVPDTEHTISTRTVDTSGNINQTWTNHTATTEPDLIPPIITIISPRNITYTTTNISLSVSANEVIPVWNYSLNGEPNVSFAPDTTIIASQGENNIIIYARDIAGNWNSSTVVFWVDSIAPSSITDLQNISYARSINWTWTDPSDPDFSRVMIYLDGIFQTNVTNGSQYYFASNLTGNTEYNISTHTVDSSGNINSTWVNGTARTPAYAPAVITVDDSGGADFTRIQDAMNASNNGDTINVAAGIYNENVLANKSVTLAGAGADVTIVNASNDNEHVFNVTVNNVTIHGFTLTGATGPEKAGIYLNAANFTNISNNNIWNDTNGIFLYSSNNNTIYNNFFNNTNNFKFEVTNYDNSWNLSKIQSKNIAGGPYTGGNFWADPGGTGFSQNCMDLEKDGICDSNYTLDSMNVDFLPLAIPPPGYINGTVMNNSVAIAGAILTLNSNVTATANASGFYSFLFPAGTYNLTATSEPMYYTNTSIIVTVISGMTVIQDIELEKKQTGNISGVVTNI